LPTRPTAVRCTPRHGLRLIAHLLDDGDDFLDFVARSGHDRITINTTSVSISDGEAVAVFRGRDGREAGAGELCRVRSFDRRIECVKTRRFALASFARSARSA